MKKKVFDVLSEDAKERHENGKLCGFKDLQRAEWDYSLPTIVDSYGYSKNSYAPATEDAALNSFFAQFPLLKEVDRTNVLIAGGSVGHFMYSKDSFTGDVDMFVFGLKNSEEATARAQRLLNDLVQAKKIEVIKKYNEREKGKWCRTPEMEIKLVRNANGVSMWLGSTHYQVIFRLYKSEAEVLYGFDLGSSAIGLSAQNKFLFTVLSRFSYEHRVNIVDTTRRSTTYEKRLLKYFEGARRFEIILPYFDLSKLSTKYFEYGGREMAIMPTLVLNYTFLTGNRIGVQSFKILHNGVVATSDYDLDDLHEFNVLQLNMAALVKNEPDKLYYYNETTVLVNAEEKKESEDDDAEESRKKKRKVENEEKTFVENFFKADPNLSVKSIQYFYDRISSNVWEKGDFRYGLLKKFCEPEVVKHVTTELFVNDVENKEKVVKEAVTKQMDVMLERFSEMKIAKNFEIKWRTENPGTHLTSSFNPIFETPEKWYGEYYKANVL